MNKKKNILLKINLISMILLNSIFAQTDPNANPNWDWRNGDDPSYQYPASRYKIYKETPEGNTIELYKDAPWNQPNAWDALDDNKPEDGWLLIARDFGTPARGVLGDNPIQKPFFILYNKYKMKLRVFILAQANEAFSGNGGMI